MTLDSSKPTFAAISANVVVSEKGKDSASVSVSKIALYKKIEQKNEPILYLYTACKDKVLVN